jgi:hypothetical protein
LLDWNENTRNHAICGVMERHQQDGSCSHQIQASHAFAWSGQFRLARTFSKGPHPHCQGLTS